MSLDGKIADRDRTPARFSSAVDLRHLEARIAEVDAVLFGAGTLRAYGTCLSVRDPALLSQRQAQQRSPQPIQILCSASGYQDPTWRFFQQAVPRWLLTTPTGAATAPTTPYFDRVLSWLTASTDWPEVLANLYDQGITRLALLGGGTLMATLAEQDAIDEWYLTICPLMLGGATAPTPVDGVGTLAALAPQFTLIQVQTVENEVFLHYRRCQPPKD